MSNGDFKRTITREAIPAKPVRARVRGNAACHLFRSQM